MNALKEFVIRVLSGELSEYRNRKPDGFSGIDEFEKTLIYSYSKETTPPTYGFRRVNNELRNGNISDYARFLDEALSKLPDHGDIVFRGDFLTKELFEKYMYAFVMQEVLVIDFFFSSTKNAKIAQHFRNSNVLISIYSRTGKVIEDFSFFGKNEPLLNEEEVLFRYGTKFRILDLDFSNAPFTIFLDEV